MNYSSCYEEYKDINKIKLVNATLHKNANECTPDVCARTVAF